MTRISTRKIALTCIECDRTYDTTIRSDQTLSEIQGRCPGCAAAALLRKWGGGGTPLIEMVDELTAAVEE